MEAPSTRELAFAAAGALFAGACLAFRSSAGSAASDEPSAAADGSAVQSRSRESETMLITVDRLKKFTSDVFVHCGCIPEEAKLAAEVLILADHRGIDSHGVARLHAYFTLLEAGEINPRPNVRKVISTATTATVDGDNGLGLIVGPKANAIAMEMAEQNGSGWVSVKNTNHVRTRAVPAWHCIRLHLHQTASASDCICMCICSHASCSPVPRELNLPALIRFCSALLWVGIVYVHRSLAVRHRWFLLPASHRP
jgi:hypothetical protein